MRRMSKYATLDARIVAAIKARKKRTRWRIINDKFVWRQLQYLGYWDDMMIGYGKAVLSLVSRRLASLRARGLIRNTPVFHRWIPVIA